MHGVIAGVGHCWSSAALSVLLDDPSVHAQISSKPSSYATGQKDACLRINAENDADWNIPSTFKLHSSSQVYPELPSIDSLISTVLEHRKTKDPNSSRHFYVRICENGLETHEELGNYIIPMLVVCGNMITAQQSFEKLAHQGEHAWTSLLQGYTESDEAHLALQCFQKMQTSEVHPSMHTYVALLKACESLTDIEEGQNMHAEVVYRGYETNPYVNNSLLCMYAKCGSVLDAQNVFDQMHVRDTIAWTTLMSAYVDCDLSEEALSCLEDIQAEGVAPDSVMYVCSIKACRNMGAIDRGQKIHQEIIEEGLETLPSVCNTLVDMYAKCGLLEEATELFHELPQKDVVSWTALITGCAENGRNEDAINYLELMQSEGTIPDKVMYVCVLKACCSIGAVHKGFELHREIVEEGFETEHLVGNTLIDMYAKFGLLAEAKAVFDQLLLRDVVSWTALIAGYAEHGLCEKVQNCLDQMQLDGCSPNVPTYVCSLKACSQFEALNWGRDMHAKFVKEGFETDTLVGSALVDMYAKCGSFVEAQAVLDELRGQNVVSWSALIAGFAEEGASEEAFKCLEKMEEAGLPSNEVALVSSLKACSRARASENGYKLHSDIVKKGFEHISTCGNALVDMYAKCGLLSASQAVFDKLPSHDVISWTALMAGYVEHGFTEEGLICFEKMRLDVSPDIMLWNTSILCYAEQEKTEDALILYMQMQEQCLLPNSHSFVSILQGCCKTAAIGTGRRIHAQIFPSVQKLEKTEELFSTALIDMYGKCGSMHEALQVFEAMSTPSIVQWNAVITGYARQGESALVFSTFERMREIGVEPDAVTFASIFFVCSHDGLMSEGQMYYEAMIKEYNIAPHIKHESCIVDLLGRVGNLNEAVVMLETLPSQEDSAAWNSVLGSCRNLGDVELSEQAFHTLMDLGQQDPTSFIMMANAYADV